jgi:hypothetical protein
MDKRLEKAKAALKARQTSFPVLVMDGDANTPDSEFRATLYGPDFQPVSKATTDMTRDELKAGQHFLNRMRTREEWNREIARG